METYSLLNEGQEKLKTFQNLMKIYTIYPQHSQTMGHKEGSSKRQVYSSKLQHKKQNKTKNWRSHTSNLITQK